MGTSEIIISLVGGFFGGILNAFAGFGSIITLAIYTDILGIPGHIANATNRVNVLASSSVSTYAFHKNGKLDLAGGKHIVISVFLGAMVGVVMATQLDAEGFKQVFKTLLIPIFLLLLSNPKRFIQPTKGLKPISPSITMPIYFLLGIYAGFLQVGFGVIFLMVAVGMSRYDLILGNGLKIGIVALYTIAVIMIFQYKGMIVWKMGLLLSVGQAVGGYVASTYMTRMKGANKWAYYILLLIVGAVIIKNFELWKYVTDLF